MIMVFLDELSGDERGAGKGNVTVARILIAAGAEKDSGANSRGMTALARAAEVAESVKARAVPTEVRRYCSSSFRLVAGEIWLYQCLEGCSNPLAVYL